MLRERASGRVDGDTHLNEGSELAIRGGGDSNGCRRPRLHTHMPRGVVGVAPPVLSIQRQMNIPRRINSIPEWGCSWCHPLHILSSEEGREGNIAHEESTGSSHHHAARRPDGPPREGEGSLAWWEGAEKAMHAEGGGEEREATQAARLDLGLVRAGWNEPSCTANMRISERDRVAERDRTRRGTCVKELGMAFCSA